MFTSQDIFLNGKIWVLKKKKKITESFKVTKSRDHRARGKAPWDSSIILEFDVRAVKSMFVAVCGNWAVANSGHIQQEVDGMTYGWGEVCSRD